MIRYTLLLVIIAFGVRAENWPQWRGPQFNGSTTETGLPATFSKTENIKWTVPLSGGSAATPIIWENSVFVCSHEDRTKELQAVCINLKDGSIRWKKGAGTATAKASQTGKNTFASPSPITDGKHVWFTFGNGEIVCFDMDGKEIWTKSLTKEYGPLAYLHGYSSTPLLMDGKLYVEMLRRDHPIDAASRADKPYDSFLLCFDAESGKELFKQVRVGVAKDGAKEAYSTPIPYLRNGKNEILVNGADCLTAHDAGTGSELWRWTGFINPGDNRHCCSPLVAGNMICLGGSQPSAAFGVRYGEEKPLWKYAEQPTNVGTPLYYKDMIYMVNHKKKVITCMKPETGEIVWTGNLGVTSEFTSSATAADGRIYVMSEAADVIVLDAGPAFKILNTVHFEDGGVSNASIAIAQKHLFIRTGQNLYCVGAK